MQFKRTWFSSLICNYLAILPWMSYFISVTQSYVHKTWFHYVPLSHLYKDCRDSNNVHFYGVMDTGFMKYGVTGKQTADALLPFFSALPAAPFPVILLFSFIAPNHPLLPYREIRILLRLVLYSSPNPVSALNLDPSTGIPPPACWVGCESGSPREATGKQSYENHLQ